MRAVSLLESREQRYTKAMNNNNYYYHLLLLLERLLARLPGADLVDGNMGFLSEEAVVCFD